MFDRSVNVGRRSQDDAPVRMLPTTKAVRSRHAKCSAPSSSVLVLRPSQQSVKIGSCPGRAFCRGSLHLCSVVCELSETVSLLFLFGEGSFRRTLAVRNRSTKKVLDKEVRATDRESVDAFSDVLPRTSKYKPFLCKLTRIGFVHRSLLKQQPSSRRVECVAFSKYIYTNKTLLIVISLKYISSVGT